MNTTILGIFLWLSNGFYFFYLMIKVFYFKGKRTLSLNISLKSVLVLPIIEFVLLTIMVKSYHYHDIKKIAGGFLWENLFTFPKGIVPLLFEFPDVKENIVSKSTIIIIYFNALIVDYLTLFL